MEFLPDSDQEKLRKTAEALLKLMGFSSARAWLKQKSPDDPLTVSLSVDDAGMLIGEHGTNLRAFEYVTKLVVRKLMPDAPRFIVDINNYREERFEDLKEYARGIASRVVREQKAAELEPMPSFERRVVHTELASRPDVTTESMGEGLDRRVVVKPL